MDYSTWHTLFYACRDAQRFWRKTRQDVVSGLQEHYTFDECNDKIALYKQMEDELYYAEPERPEGLGLIDSRFTTVFP